MSHKSTDVRTPGLVAIAKKWKLPVAKVMELVNQGAEVEKEHNKSIIKARQVARDHINERPDYYKKLKKMEKTPISVKEETGVLGVRGLGNVTGSPGVDPVQSYININSMAYQDDNGNKLDMIKKKHLDYHNSKLGFNFFDPTDGNASNKTLKEAKHPLQVNFDKYRKGKLNELGGNVGYEGLTDAPPRERKELVKEGPKLDKAKKVAMAGMTAANMYTMSDVAGRATEGGHGSPRGDVVRAASAMPGAVGWGATVLHYGNKGYKLARQALQKKGHMEEEKKMSNPCWKGYKAYGMKKKDGKEVPNCVPVEEQGSSATPYTERPTYESAAWQRKEGKNPEGGLNRKGIASYRRENPGSKLSMAVTTKPSKLKPGSKAANRRKSFCARMGGMPGPMKDEKGRPTRKALSLRKWNCEEENKYPQTAERGIYEKAPPGAKYERMVQHIKDRLGANGLTDKEKGIAFATAWKSYNRKKLNEMDTDAFMRSSPASKNIIDRRPGLSSTGIKNAVDTFKTSMKQSEIKDKIHNNYYGTPSTLDKVKSTVSNVSKGMTDVAKGMAGTARDTLGLDMDKPVVKDIAKTAARGISPVGSAVAKAVSSALPSNEPKKVDPATYDTSKAYSGLSASERGPISSPGGATPPSISKNPSIPSSMADMGSPSTPDTDFISKMDAETPRGSNSRSTTTTPKRVDEISDTLVGAANNATFWKGRTPSKRLERYVKRAQVRDPEEHKKKEKEKKKQVKENMKDSDWLYGNGQLKEELQMENQNLINEALENILENNLNEMKENLLAAINEKAMEKLEERKKAIAADYFAQ